MSQAYVGTVESNAPQPIVAYLWKVLFALGLVVAATIALTESEILVAHASNISNSDLNIILSSD